MGPVQSPSYLNAAKQRSKHVWDIGTTAWTDGVGSQEPYPCAVKEWSVFHDNLPTYNSNRIANNLRGIGFHAQLRGRSRDICKVLNTDQLRRDGAPAIIGSLLYQRDPMTAASDAVSDLVMVRTFKHMASGNYRNYESRFQALMTK